MVSFFPIAYHLPFWPLCIGCALAATAGRYGLALTSERWGRRLLTAQHRANVAALCQWLNERSGWRGALAVMVYSLGPIPSNQLFIAAVLSGARLTPIATGFLVGRLVSYPALAFTARGVTDQFGNLFTQGWRDPKAIALELLSMAGIVLFARIDWPRVLSSAGSLGDRSVRPRWRRALETAAWPLAPAQTGPGARRAWSGEGGPRPPPCTRWGRLHDRL